MYGKRLLRPFLEPGLSPWLFLIAAVLLGAIGNATYEMLKALWGTALAALATSVGVLVLLALLRTAYHSYLARRLEPEQVRPCQGLIVLVSQGKPANSAAGKAIRYHLGECDVAPGRLTHCYLIAGKRARNLEEEPSDSSWRNACRLQEQYRERLQVCDVIEVVPERCEDVRKSCNEAWRRLGVAGLPRREVIADLTGGTKIMTVGVVLSALEMGYRLEYLQARVLTEKGTIAEGSDSDPRAVNLRSFQRELWEE